MKVVFPTPTPCPLHTAHDTWPNAATPNTQHPLLLPRSSPPPSQMRSSFSPSQFYAVPTADDVLDAIIVVYYRTCCVYSTVNDTVQHITRAVMLRELYNLFQVKAIHSNS